MIATNEQLNSAINEVNAKVKAGIELTETDLKILLLAHLASEEEHESNQ